MKFEELSTQEQALVKQIRYSIEALVFDDLSNVVYQVPCAWSPKEIHCICELPIHHIGEDGCIWLDEQEGHLPKFMICPNEYAQHLIIDACAHLFLIPSTQDSSGKEELYKIHDHVMTYFGERNFFIRIPENRKYYLNDTMFLVDCEK